MHQFLISLLILLSPLMDDLVYTPEVIPVDADGIKKIVEQNRGNVILLNLWATWCEPCKDEFPDLLRLRGKYREKGLTLILVSVDRGKILEKSVKPFLKSHNVRFPTYIKKSGKDQSFIEAIDPDWPGAIPFSVIYGRDGTKRSVFLGKLSFEEFEKAVQKWL